MIKLLISLFILIISLSGCKGEDDSISTQPLSFHMEFDNYDDMNSYMSEHLEKKPCLPNIKIDGIVKCKYVISGYCSCERSKGSTAHDDDYTFKCPNFSFVRNLFYFYTAEDKTLMLESANAFEQLNTDKGTVESNKNDSILSHIYLCFINDSTILSVNASDNTNKSNEYEGENRIGVFTREEIDYWYDLFIKEMSRYSKDYRMKLNDNESFNKCLSDINNASYFAGLEIEGVNKIEYLIDGTCRCPSMVKIPHDDNDTVICPDFKIKKIDMTIYTDETKHFDLSLTSSLDSAKLVCGGALPIKKDDVVVEYSGYIGDGKVYFKADADYYTYDEAQSWYKIAYNVLVEAQKI